MTDKTTYYAPQGGLPGQQELLSSRAIFTNAYAVIPRRVMTDIVVSFFPGWTYTRGWVLARPLTGFAETFAQIIMEVSPGGGSDRPEIDPGAECVIFVLEGQLEVTLNGQVHTMQEGGYAYLPPLSDYKITNTSDQPVRFCWIRKAYEPVEGIEPPSAFFTNERDTQNTEMQNTSAWSTTRFVDPADMAHDMHVNIVNFLPGGAISFSETHVMEHGIYILEGKGVYRLNDDWVEVQAGDFLWLRAFCPQACYAGGPDRFRYLLYKDVNRHPALRLP